MVRLDGIHQRSTVLVVRVMSRLEISMGITKSDKRECFHFFICKRAAFGEGVGEGQTIMICQRETEEARELRLLDESEWSTVMAIRKRVLC